MDMPNGNTVKYFLSLQLPDACKDFMSQAADHLLKEYGDVLEGPMKKSSYHITLGVMEMNDDKVATMEQLRFTLQTYLDMLTCHDLVFEEAGWFDDGAVYLKMDDERTDAGPEHIKIMRNSIEKICEKEGIKLFKMTNFHITLFKKNKIAEGTFLYMDDYYVAPLGPKGSTTCSLTRGSITTVDLRKVKNW